MNILLVTEVAVEARAFIFAGSLALALPAAWLSWHGIEKWALHWSRRLPARQLAAAAGD